MTQTKTVSTRIDNNVHTLFTDYCNQQGMTMSQMLSQFVNDVVEANKDLVDLSQCSIESNECPNGVSKFFIEKFLLFFSGYLFPLKRKLQHPIIQLELPSIADLVLGLHTYYLSQ